MAEKITITELSSLGNVEPDFVIEMVEYGILTPSGKNASNWQFDTSDLFRFKKALRLFNDLELNLQGTALAVELIEQLEVLHAELEALHHKLKLLHLDDEQ